MSFEGLLKLPNVMKPLMGAGFLAKTGNLLPAVCPASAQRPMGVGVVAVIRPRASQRLAVLLIPASVGCLSERDVCSGHTHIV